MLNKYLFHFFLFFQLFILDVSAQKTIISENFGGTYAHNESMSSNSSGWIHTGTGDFIHKIVSGSGASGSNCFAQTSCYLYGRLVTKNQDPHETLRKASP